MCACYMSDRAVLTVFPPLAFSLLPSLTHSHYVPFRAKRMILMRKMKISLPSTRSSRPLPNSILPLPFPISPTTLFWRTTAPTDRFCRFCAMHICPARSRLASPSSTKFTSMSSGLGCPKYAHWLRYEVNGSIWGLRSEGINMEFRRGSKEGDEECMRKGL